MTSPQGKLGAGNRYERPLHTTFHVCVTTHLRLSSGTPWGGDFWELVPGVFQTSLYLAFLLLSLL